MNDKELDKSIKKSFENFIKELATNPEKVFDNDKLQIKYNKVLKEKIKLQSNWNSLREINNEAREYLTSYEAISTIQGLDNIEKNKQLDENTINEMTNRYLKVHHKLLSILDKMNELEGKNKE